MYFNVKTILLLSKHANQLMEIYYILMNVIHLNLFYYTILPCINKPSSKGGKNGSF